MEVKMSNKNDNELLLGYLDKLAGELDLLRKALGRDIRRGVMKPASAKMTPASNVVPIKPAGLDSVKWGKLRNRTSEVLSNTNKPKEDEDCDILCMSTRFKLLIY